MTVVIKKVTLKSGKTVWEAVADGPTDPVTGKRKQIRRRGTTKREAREKVQNAIRSLTDDGIDESAAERVTFDKAAEHWLKVYELTGVKKSTIRVRQKEINILNKHIAKLPIIKVTPLRYQKLINDIAPHYARTTVQGVNICARMIFKQAIRDKIIKHNPTDDVVIPKKRRSVKDIEKDEISEKYFERDELETFLKAVDEYGLENDKEWFYLLAFTGMRSGELLALKWSDVDFENNEIRITKTMYNPNNNMREYELTPPKTDGSVRTITVEDEIMDMLKSHYMKQKKMYMKYRHEIEEFHDANFVFAHSNGYPFVHRNIIDRMDRIMGFTLIEKKAKPHLLRHTHISMMTEAGVDLATIMDRVGHEDVQTTLNIYTHVSKKMKKDASTKIKNLYENVFSNLI